MSSVGKKIKSPKKIRKSPIKKPSKLQKSKLIFFFSTFWRLSKPRIRWPKFRRVIPCAYFPLALKYWWLLEPAILVYNMTKFSGLQIGAIALSTPFHVILSNSLPFPAGWGQKWRTLLKPPENLVHHLGVRGVLPDKKIIKQKWFHYPAAYADIFDSQIWPGFGRNLEANVTSFTKSHDAFFKLIVV